MSESLVDKQLRLVLERQCQELADHLKPKVPAGVGYFLLLSDYGAVGNTAYVSTFERASAIELMQEWLDRQDDNYDVKTLRELLLVAGDLIEKIADAVGFARTEEGVDPAALIEHCRKLRGRS